LTLRDRKICFIFSTRKQQDDTSENSFSAACEAAPLQNRVVKWFENGLCESKKGLEK
jgi:hypothetical protein